MVMEDRPRVSWTIFMVVYSREEQGGGAVAKVVEAEGRYVGSLPRHARR